MSERKPPGAPIVFIASTAKDLEEYREAAALVARKAGFQAVLAEDWEARDHSPLNECLKRVDGTHLTVVIAAHRYGWVPNDQEGEKSITWLECERTKANGNDLLAFVHEEPGAWPKERLEKFRLMEVDDETVDLNTLRDEIKRNERALLQFKGWLNESRIRNTFTSVDDLKLNLFAALQQWRSDRPEFRSTTPANHDPTRYLQHLLSTTDYINIRGLGGDRAHNFRIEELYMELSTDLHGDRDLENAGRALALEQALGEPRLLVIGDPGAGKTTFLHRVARLLAKRALGEPLDSREERWVPEKEYLPLFVPIAVWLEHIDAVPKQRRRERHPTTANDPQWLAHFLGEAAGNGELELDAEWFRDRLKRGEAMLLLDGLDEATDRLSRERAVALIEALAAAYRDCPLVVTSRPLADEGDVALPGFRTARIQPMDDEAVEHFLGRWSEALYRDDRPKASAHRDALLKALNARPNIRRLARNMVMLTALAVVHWNERRLPEQRAELYEAILLWLARSREKRPGRLNTERCLEALRRLALEMLRAPEGRQVQVTHHWAAEQVAPLFNDREAAKRFLADEELDSGIVVRRGNQLRFQHLTFQEYLAARAIGGLGEAEQRKLLLGDGKRIYAPEWRETVLLLGGVLHEQGVDKVDELLSALFQALGEQPPLPEAARAAGLVGALVRDLSPYAYTPADDRYRQTLDRVMAIFTPEGAAQVPVKGRISATEALGQASDPRLMEEAEGYWIPFAGATFTMGAQNRDAAAANYDPEAKVGETPRRVTLPPFRLARRPVTVTEFARFMDDGGYHDRRWWRADRYGEVESPKEWEKQVNHPNRPVTGVSWFEANAYCAWLTEHRRRQGRIGADEIIRLPREEEWEWAARGEGLRRYPWGDEEATEERLNSGSSVGAPSPVGIYPLGHTPEGLEDMAGNVWEWCLNEYDAPERAGTEGDAHRGLRGGSWLGHRGWARCAARGGYYPNARLGNLGFRVLCVSPIVSGD